MALLPGSFKVMGWLVLLWVGSGMACDCYKTSSPVGTAIFRHFAFYDFRAISAQGTDDFSKPPPLITSQQDDGTEGFTASYLASSEFNSAWTIQNWRQNGTNAGPVTMVNSRQNVYILQDSPASPTYLVLRTSRLANFQSASEMVTTEQHLLYSSIRTSARIRGDSGAVAGLFTYADADNESDMEILLRDAPTYFRATNQPGVDADGRVIVQASSVEGIPGEYGAQNASRGDWNEFRMDWLPSITHWIVNGAVAVSKTYGVPTRPSYFNLNVWSNGGTWSGNMSVGALATMDVQWIEMVYNISGEDPSACTVLYGVDGNATLGSPVVLSKAAKQLEHSQMSFCAFAAFVVSCLLQF